MIFSAIWLFQFDLEEAAFLYNPAGLTAVRGSISPEHITKLVGLHYRSPILGRFHPCARTQENDDPVRMRMQRRRLAVPFSYLEDPDTLIVQHRLIYMWGHPDGVQRG
jgi:hypothetical protein